MTTRPAEVIDGLAVRKDHTGWTVVHDASGLYVASSLRLRRFAEEARAEFLATGADFTVSQGKVAAQRERWSPVYSRWWQRARQEHLDLDTLEYYGSYTRYGQVIPSAERVASLCAARDNVLADLERGREVKANTDDRYAVLRAYEAAGKAVYVPGEGWHLVSITAESPAELDERGEELAREERADCSS